MLNIVLGNMNEFKNAKSCPIPLEVYNIFSQLEHNSIKWIQGLYNKYKHVI